jgi:hypothetical protein
MQRREFRKITPKEIPLPEFYLLNGLYEQSAIDVVDNYKVDTYILKARKVHGLTFTALLSRSITRFLNFIYTNSTQKRIKK